MKKTISFLIIIAISFLASIELQAASKQKLTKVKEQMIEESINSYSGNCPCPYNSMRNGRSCGRRSAYSRPGGAAPLCYSTDISDKQAKAYLKKNK